MASVIKMCDNFQKKLSITKRGGNFWKKIFWGKPELGKKSPEKPECKMAFPESFSGKTGV